MCQALSMQRWCKQIKIKFMLCCTRVVSSVLVLPRVALVLSRVVSCCTRVMSCCTLVVSRCVLFYSCCVVLCRVVTCVVSRLDLLVHTKGQKRFESQLFHYRFHCSCLITFRLVHTGLFMFHFSPFHSFHLP